MAQSKGTLNKKGKPRKTAEEAAAKRAAKGTATTKTLAGGTVKVKQQPDDPGADKLSLEELKASWATTPEWVKGALVLAALVAIVGLLI